jgi:hypothetical protein
VPTNRPGQDLVGDLTDRTTDHQPQAPVVGVRAHDDVDMPTRTGGDPLNRAAGHDLTIDHRLPRHGAGHHGLAPTVRVRIGEQLRLQLRLRRQQPLHASGRDGLSRRSHPELRRQVPSDA